MNSANTLISLIGLLVLCSTSLAQETMPPVEIELQCKAQANLSDLTFTLRNPGTADTAVVLGSTLGNGSVYLAQALSIEVRFVGTSSSSTFIYFNRDHALVAGRQDPWILPLPARSEFSLTIRSEDFWLTDLNKPLSDMRDIAEINAHLTAGKIVDVSLDMPGVALTRVWIGEAQSSALPVPSDCTSEN